MSAETFPPVAVTVSPIGDAGPSGVGVESVEVAGGRLIVTLTNGDVIDAGAVGGGGGGGGGGLDDSGVSNLVWDPTSATRQALDMLYAAGVTDTDIAAIVAADGGQTRTALDALYGGPVDLPDRLAAVSPLVVDLDTAIDSGTYVVLDPAFFASVQPPLLNGPPGVGFGALHVTHAEVDLYGAGEPSRLVVQDVTGFGESEGTPTTTRWQRVNFFGAWQQWRSTSGGGDGVDDSALAGLIADEFTVTRATLDGLYDDTYAPTIPATPVSARIDIVTAGKAPVTSKETYLSATITASGVPGVPDYAGLTQIKVRGNFTADQPKKSFRLKLANSTALLGMPKSKDWGLIAHGTDESLINNALAYSIGAQADGLDWTPGLEYAQVWLNGAYWGAYLVTELVKLDGDRVDGDEPGETGLSLTGTYLMEIDSRGQDAGTDPGFTTSRGVGITYDDPDELTPAQDAYISGWVQDFEDALFGPDWLDPDLGYARFIDRDSFIDWYLIEELAANQDSNFFSSCKCYKTPDTAETPGRLFMGPLWDFDLAFGNMVGTTFPSTGFRTRPGASWITRMYFDPDFVTAVAARWALLKATLTDPASGYAATIGALSARTASVGLADQERWDYESDWAAAASFKMTWLAERIAWFDLHITDIVDPEAPFSPSDLGGLALWLEADTLDGATVGDPLTTWPDQSDAHRDATGTGAGRPTVVSDAGMTGVQFDGTDDELVGDFAATNRSMTFFKVANRPNVPLSVRDHGYWIPGVMGDNYNTRGGDGYVGIPFPVADGSYHVYAATGGGGGDTGKTYVDGALHQSATLTGGDEPPSAKYTLGTSNLGAEYQPGIIRAALIYSRVLSDAEREQVEDYLRAKYSTP